MNFRPSINIEDGIEKSFRYIVTPNAKSVVGQIADGFRDGQHSQTVIGTYGTGKSCFLAALSRDLSGDSSVLIQDKTIFSPKCKDFKCVNIVGDFKSLQSLLAERLDLPQNAEDKDILKALDIYYTKLKKKGIFLFIIIDEFGKILEHAAKKDPEEELYFLQKLAEYVNAPSRNIILLCTLHQNFSSYARRLDQTQRDEWKKVKGRYKEIVFAEPVEQILLLASQQIKLSNSDNKDNKNFEALFTIAKKSKFVSERLSYQTAVRLFPIDPIAAIALTIAIQRYGQNERTLFSFLTSTGDGSLVSFSPTSTLTYNLAQVYDYVVYNFYSYLSEPNADSMNWRALQSSIERVEGCELANSIILNGVKVVKTIGLLNLFAGNNVSFNRDMLLTYCKYALDIPHPESIISELESRKIIRFAAYKSQYILFDGTDINIEDSLLRASSSVPVPIPSVVELGEYVSTTVVNAVAAYYQKGTPRYFEFVTTNAPEAKVPQGDIDGYIQLIFPLSDNVLNEVMMASSHDKEANIYVYYNNMGEITRHLHQIKKLKYVIETEAFEDRVAKKELNNLISYENYLLNQSINKGLYANDGSVIWIYKGVARMIGGSRQFQQLLTEVCNDVYSKTPIIHNELINKQKISSAISLAKANLLTAILENSSSEDLGFKKDLFPPEKTIYYSLLKETGIHQSAEKDIWYWGAPTNPDIQSLWNVCEEFVNSSTDKARKLSELLKVLRNRPYKLKQGVIDFWLPIYLYVKQQDFSLYNGDGVYIMNINREVFDLLQKRPDDFSIKAFNVTGVKLEFFKKYTTFLQKGDNVKLSTKTFIGTFKPFLQFYRSLNQYAKTTTKFDNPSTQKFRDALANAKDPEKTFFEELPIALGYKDDNAVLKEEFAQQYDTLIKKAVHELRLCYSNFIDRIESFVISELSLPNDFFEYKNILESRYKDVKSSLLPPKTKIFYDRVMVDSTTKQEFYEKICNTILDKKLEQIKDSEEDMLIENLLYLFRELERYTSISTNMVENHTDDELYNFEIASNIGEMKASQTFRLPFAQKEKAHSIERAISKVLSGDDNLDVCVLLRMLNEKLSKK